MTHDDWLASNDPHPMLVFLLDNGWLSERKARLFACACVRRVWDLLTDQRSRRAVDVAERFADGGASQQDLAEAFQAAKEAEQAAWATAHRAAWRRSNSTTVPAEHLTASAADAAFFSAWKSAGDGAIWVCRSVAINASRMYFRDDEAWTPPADARIVADHQAHVALLRDIFGDPFAPPPTVAPSVLVWNAGMVPQLARSIYEQGSFNDLPVLADALEEAGSTDVGLLAHFRGGGPHAKGCVWLDAVLGLR